MNSSPMISWTSVSRKGLRAGDVQAGQVGDGESGDDRGDQAGVVAGDVAACGDEDHRRELGKRAERLPQPQFAQRQPEDAGSDRAARQTDAHADEELPDLVATADVDLPAGRDGVEDDGAEDAADRVGERPLPDQDAPYLVRRPDVLEQWPDDGGARHDQDHADHRRHPQRDPEERRADGADGEEGDQDADDQQPSDRAAGLALEVAEVQSEAGCRRGSPRRTARPAPGSPGR